MENTETGESKNVVYLIEPAENTIKHSFYITMTLFVANSKMSENIGEGENNESTEEKTVSKPAVKEEVETSDVKVETPELKVGQCSSLEQRWGFRVGLTLMVHTDSFRSDNWPTP